MHLCSIITAVHTCSALLISINSINMVCACARCKHAGLPVAALCVYVRRLLNDPSCCGCSTRSSLLPAWIRKEVRGGSRPFYIDDVIKDMSSSSS